MTVLLVPTVVNALRERVVAATVAIPTEDLLVAQIAIATVAVAVVVQITTVPRLSVTLVLTAKQVHLDLHHRHIVPRQKKVTVFLVPTIANALRELVVAAIVAIPTEDPLVAQIATATVIVAVVVRITTVPRLSVMLVLMGKQVHLDLPRHLIVPRQKKVQLLILNVRSNKICVNGRKIQVTTLIG